VFCVDLVEQKVSCDEVAKNILKFLNVVTRRLPVGLHLSIHKKENMKLQLFFVFPFPNSFSPLAMSFSLFSNLMPRFVVETWERVFKPKSIN
jgi:hypothetical protein